MNTVDGAGTNRPDAAAAALPRFETGLAVAELDLHGGALFWEEVKGFTAGPAAAPLVDRVLKARPLPRVWLFLDEPEQTATRAAAALAAARELVRRRYTVLVIDADDRRPDLTRWAGRHEREGWIDLVRYGASLAAGSVPVPFAEEPAARLLGVGSFCPAEATREEIAWLCARLSSQADFLLVAAPLGPGGEAWLPAAQLRLLCWDRTGRSEAATAALAAGAAESGAPLGGLVTFGAPGLELLPPPPEPAAGPASGAEGAEAARESAGEARREQAAPAATAAGGEAGWAPAARTSAAGAVGAAGAAGLSAAAAPAVSRAGNDARRRPSSPLARRLAVVLSALVVIVGAALAWRLFQPRPRLDLSQLASPTAAPDISRPVAAPPGGETAAAPAVGAADTAIAAATGAGATGAGTTGADGMGAADTGADAAGADGMGAADTGAGVAGADGADPSRARPAAPAAPPAEAGFDPAPYRLPVGRDGWALHVYSLPDSAQAEREIRRLRGLGLTAGWRAVELPGRGRWYRISLGSFPDRASAARALPALLRRLDADWGQPVSY